MPVCAKLVLQGGVEGEVGCTCENVCTDEQEDLEMGVDSKQ